MTAISYLLHPIVHFPHWWNQQSLLTKVFHASKILLFVPYPWTKTIGALSFAHSLFSFCPSVAKDLALARELSREVDAIISELEQNKSSSIKQQTSALLDKTRQFQGNSRALQKAIETLEEWEKNPLSSTPEERAFVSHEFKDFIQEMQARFCLFPLSGLFLLMTSPHIQRFARFYF